jgi:hypothetical protein
VISQRCDVALCADKKCFVDYHNKADPWNFSGFATGPPYANLGPQLEK